MKPTYKVDLRMIERAKALRIKGASQEEIACDLGISQGTVSVILRTQGLGGRLFKPPAPLTLLRRRG